MAGFPSLLNQSAPVFLDGLVDRHPPSACGVLLVPVSTAGKVLKTQPTMTGREVGSASL